MEMSGQQRIPAPRALVWEALNDAEILKASIPGCESLERNESGDGFDAKVRAKVGPVSARFGGTVILSDITPPERYTISGEGKGGSAGFAKGSAKVQLTEDGNDTLLNYTVDARVGGKLAQLGSRLIDGTARKMAEDFFTRFSEIVQDRSRDAETVPEPTGAKARADDVAAVYERSAASEGAAPSGATAQVTPLPTEPQPAEQATAKTRGMVPALWVALAAAIVMILLVLIL